MDRKTLSEGQNYNFFVMKVAGAVNKNGLFHAPHMILSFVPKVLKVGQTVF